MPWGGPAPPACGGPRGYDAGNKIKGRKRHSVVDVEGSPLMVPASRTVTAVSFDDLHLLHRGQLPDRTCIPHVLCFESSEINAAETMLNATIRPFTIPECLTVTVYATPMAIPGGTISGSSAFSLPRLTAFNIPG